MILNNVGIATEGVDVPDTEVVIMNRATKSLGLFVQMVGRGLRPANGKVECIVLDHGGNTIRHGFVEEYDLQDFSLEGFAKKKKKEQEEFEKHFRKCPQCYRVMKEDRCQCGFQFEGPSMAKLKEYDRDVQLELLKKGDAKVAQLMNRRHEDLKLSELRLFAKMKGYNYGWSKHQAARLGLKPSSTGPKFYQELEFVLSLNELKDGTYDLHKELKRK
jgi:superfamily II DNA or RNA helicase